MQSATMPSLKVNCDAADDHGIAHANRLVQSIFRQITDGDAPSRNFEDYDAIRSLTGSNHGGNHHNSRQGNSGGGVSISLPSAKKSSAARTSSQSNHRFANESYSQGDYNDAASATASEHSVSSGSGVSSFASPKPSSRFPPRPPSSNSSYKKDLYDTSNHSNGDKLSLSTHSTASSYGIGASLMGTLALADLCSRTVEAGSRKEGEKRGKNYLNNHQFLPGALPPPPLSPLESEESSPRGKERNLLSMDDQTKAGLGKFYEQINPGLGKLAVKPSHELPSDEGPTPRVYNGGKDAPSFDVKNPCDNQGFPRHHEMDTKNNDIEQNESWKTESGTFSFDDAIAEEGRNKFVGEEQATPVQRPAGGHRSGSPLTVQRSLSTDSAGRSAGQKRRIMMFGSEYARILSSSKPLSPSPNVNHHLLSSASKVKRSSSAVSNKIKARFSSSVSGAQSYASSGKESVESGGSVILTLDDCPISVATAAITDVIVTDVSDIPPRGYYRAFQLGEESLKNMVPGRKRQRLFLNVKKEPSWDRAVQRPCVTAFCIIYPDRNEFVPPGFSVVRHY